MTGLLRLPHPEWIGLIRRLFFERRKRKLVTQYETFMGLLVGSVFVSVAIPTFADGSVMATHTPTPGSGADRWARIIEMISSSPGVILAPPHGMERGLRTRHPAPLHRVEREPGGEVNQTIG